MCGQIFGNGFSLVYEPCSDFGLEVLSVSASKDAETFGSFPLTFLRRLLVHD